MPHYAWSPIRTTKAGKRVVIPRGESVDAAKLGIDEENFQALVDSGAVRDKKLPSDMPKDWDGSIIDWHRQQLSDVSVGQIDEEAQASALATVVEAENAG